MASIVCFFGQEHIVFSVALLDTMAAAGVVLCECVMRQQPFSIIIRSAIVVVVVVCFSRSQVLSQQPVEGRILC